MFRRKQSLGRTRRELLSLEVFDRERVMDWWTLAEERMHPPSGNFSGPAGAVAMSVLLGGSDGINLEAAAGLMIGVRAGYSLRAVLGQFVPQIASLDISPLDTEPIIELADRPREEDTGLLIAGDDADEIVALLEPVAELVGTYAGERFADIASVEPAFWNGVVSIATYQLQRNLGSALDSETSESLMRWGFALRALDEALGIEPDRGRSLDRPPSHERTREQPLWGSPVGSGPLDRLTDPPARARTLGDLDEADQLPSGSPLDVDEWLRDAAAVCTQPFEPFAERVLELSAIEHLGIERVVDRFGRNNRKPVTGHDVEAAGANARLGYALRNREVQLITCRDVVHPEDPLALLLAERAHNSGLNVPTINRMIRDVLELQYEGGRDRLYGTTPGTTPALRGQVFEQWADRHFPGDDPRTGRAMTIALLEYGYFLHRLFEICPERLEPWS